MQKITGIDIQKHDKSNRIIKISLENDIIDNDDDIDILVDIKNRDEVISKIKKSNLEIDYSNPYNNTPFFLQVSNMLENVKNF